MLVKPKGPLVAAVTITTATWAHDSGHQGPRLWRRLPHCSPSLRPPLGPPGAQPHTAWTVSMHFELPVWNGENRQEPQRHSLQWGAKGVRYSNLSCLWMNWWMDGFRDGCKELRGRSVFFSSLYFTFREESRNLKEKTSFSFSKLLWLKVLNSVKSKCP